MEWAVNFTGCYYQRNMFLIHYLFLKYIVSESVGV